MLLLHTEASGHLQEKHRVTELQAELTAFFTEHHFTCEIYGQKNYGYSDLIFCRYFLESR